MVDSRELESRIKMLHKASTNNEPASVLINIIDMLKKGDAPTEEQLRTTRAGIVVGKLRSNASKDVARLATEVVQKWRKGVEAEKAAKLKGAKMAGDGSPSTKSASPAPAASSSAASASKVTGDKAKFTGDPETRKHKTDKVDVDRTSSQTRNACIGLIYDGLAYRSTESPSDVVSKAIEVEAAAFAVYKGETADYKKKIRSLFQNLKNKTNRELGKNVLSGATTAEKFVVMSHDELKSAEQKKLEHDLEVENMKKAQVPQAQRSISDALRCGKCGQKKVSYSQAQTRSADEPMTTFCECTICGNRWKFS